MGFAVGLNSIAIHVEMPARMLVIVTRINDITTIDLAQSFGFAGSDVSRKVYKKLVNFAPCPCMWVVVDRLITAP